MGYRDELEAAHARAEALKQELADKDAEIDELEDKLTDKQDREKAERKQQRRERRRAMFKGWLPWTVLSVFLLTGLGGVIYVCVGAFSQKINGTLEASGKQLGDWVIAPDECDSGQRNGFRGVDLYGDGLRFRLLETLTNGPALVIHRGEKKLALLYKSNCKTFNRTVKKTNTTVNDVRLLDGSLELDCTLPRGGTLRGRVTFENCR